MKASYYPVASINNQNEKKNKDEYYSMELNIANICNHYFSYLDVYKHVYISYLYIHDIYIYIYVSS